MFDVENYPIPIGLLGNASVLVTNIAGDTLYYADHDQVSSSNFQGVLLNGSSATFIENIWVVSASRSTVTLAFTAPSSGSGGSGGSVTVQGAQGTNLGATQTIDFASTAKEIWLVGTLNANLTATLSNRVAGCRARLQLLQDGSGLHTLTVSDGTNTKSVSIASAAGAYSEVLVDMPDATNVNVGPVGGASGVTSVAAGDTSVVVGGTASAPTISTGTLDVIAADHPAAADWSNNNHKITGLANGTAASDAAAFGQIPTSLPTRQQALWTALGLISENYRVTLNNTATALTSQSVAAGLLGLLAGDVATNLVVCVVQAGAGTAPTLIRLGLADKTGKILAVTADVHASALWTATGIASFALTAPLTVPSTDGYYACILENGAFATTALQISSVGGNGPQAGAIGTGKSAFASAGPLTDLPAVNSSLTLAAAVKTPWFGVS